MEGSRSVSLASVSGAEGTAILYAAGHGAIDPALSGYAEVEKDLGAPMEIVRLLLSKLRCD